METDGTIAFPFDETRKLTRTVKHGWTPKKGAIKSKLKESLLLNRSQKKTN